MVTKKKMTVPIFDYRLTILIYDSWDEVSYLFDSGPEPLAITRFQYGAALVAVNSRRGSSIIHEAEHIKNNIWEYIGYNYVSSKSSNIRGRGPIIKYNFYWK